LRIADAAHDRHADERAQSTRAIARRFNADGWAPEHGKITIGTPFDRVHQKGLIDNPRSKAKSVILTEAGSKRAENCSQGCICLAIRFV
jgi:Domain of unknown function (DUF6429)